MTLIQEGMIGLFKAIQNYQPDREASFQTFAGLCIDRQLYSAVQNSNRQKHLPLNTYISLSNEEESEHLEGSWDSRTEDPESIVIDAGKYEKSGTEDQQGLKSDGK